MSYFMKIFTLTASALLVGVSLVVAPIGVSESASAETMISQLGADIDPQASNDELGKSVSLSSDSSRVAVGAPYNDAGGTSAGQVKLYDWNGTNWIQAGADIYGETSGDRSGWSVSLSGDGSTVAIGAPKNDGTGSDAGHVRLYEWNASTSEWDMFGEIDGEATGDESGTSVSLSNDGSRVAIGAPYNDGASGSNADAGHVRVYKWDGASWTQVSADIDGDVADDESGHSVSLSGNGLTVAVGAPRNDDAFADAGQVKLYEWDTTGSELGWSQLSTAINGGAVDDESGSSVSLSSDGTTVAIGSPYFSDGGSKVYAGKVNVYKWDGAVWTQVGADIDGDAEDLLGFSVSLSSDGTTVAIGGPNDLEDINYAGYVRVYELIGATWTQVSADINGEAGGDVSGYSVSLSGDGSRIAIGAPANGGAGAYAGHVRLYDRSGIAWTQVGADIDGDAAGDESGSSVSLSGDGSRVAIGAPYNDDGGLNAGQVKLYDWNQANSTWIQVGSDINGEAAEEKSGYSVSLSRDGSTVAISAPYNDGAGGIKADVGLVRVYQLIGATWTKLGADIQGESAYDYSGKSVSLSSDGSTVAIGSQDNNYDAGHVRVYQLIDGTNWTQVGLDIDGGAAGDQSGHSVSLSGNGSRVVIGSPRNDDAGDRAGQVRFFDWNGANWTQAGDDINGEAAGDLLGFSVSLSTDGFSVAIGAPYNDDGGADAGQIRVYKWDSANWTQVSADIEGDVPGDRSGYSVSLSSDGSTVTAGAPGDPDGGPTAGHASVYKLSGATWTQVGADIDGEAAADQMGYSVSISSDGSRIAIGAPYNGGAGADAGHVRIFSLTFSAPEDPAPAAWSPAPYSGPLVTDYSDKTPAIGDEVVVSGRRLNLVTSCWVDGIEVAMSDQSAVSFTIVIPLGVEPGLRDLMISSSFGTLTAQGAFTVEAKPAVIEESSPVLSKVNAGSFNNYVAVYAKGYKGQTLAWKIAGKWFKVVITKDYQVFQRKTIAVGLEVKVDLFIDGERLLAKTVLTK